MKEDGGKVALYEDLFLKKLGVPRKFLRRKWKVIREKLAYAAGEFKRDHGNLFAVNMCLHAASSVILSNPGRLKETLEKIKEIKGLGNKDATTVLTVCALYYLIQWDAGRAELQRRRAKTKADAESLSEHKAKLEEVRKGFDAINWLVGEDAMGVLGLKKAGPV